MDIRRSNLRDLGMLTGLRELRLLVMGQQMDLAGLAPLHLSGSSPVTVLRDDAGYLGCSFKHSNLKHMCDRHAQRANDNALAAPDIGEAPLGPHN